MSPHPLEQVIRSADGLVLIGDSANDRLPAMSFHSYTTVGKRFSCLDLGGSTESRGSSKGFNVYGSAAQIPADRGDLAVIWVLPEDAARAVDIAHGLGCTKGWFSFKTANERAVEQAQSLGLDVVEIGRCPVHYVDEMVGACKAHTRILKLSGAYGKPPQTDVNTKRRELW